MDAFLAAAIVALNALKKFPAAFVMSSADVVAERLTIDSEVVILNFLLMPSYGDDGNHRYEKAHARSTT